MNLHPIGELKELTAKVFTKWVNLHLLQARMIVNNLFEELSEGQKFIRLVEILSDDSLVQ